MWGFSIILRATMNFFHNFWTLFKALKKCRKFLFQTFANYQEVRGLFIKCLSFPSLSSSFWPKTNVLATSSLPLCLLAGIRTPKSRPHRTLLLAWPSLFLPLSGTRPRPNPSSTVTAVRRRFRPSPTNRRPP